MSDAPLFDPAGKKFIILGTAPTWRQAPWDDPDAVIAGLNDAYLLGLPRYDLWYDLHPFQKFYFTPEQASRKIPAHQVPAGTFVRPPNHVAWLAKQTCPVFVQTAQPKVPNAQIFPAEAITAKFGPWFDSTPAWILAHAITLGFKEIHIYGIHLATEWEYLKQKPNMAFLIGVAVGAGVKVVVPAESPLLRSTHRYAYEPDPEVPVQQADRDLDRLRMEKRALEQSWAASRSVLRPKGDRLLRQRIDWLAAQIVDGKQAKDWLRYQAHAVTG